MTIKTPGREALLELARFLREADGSSLDLELVQRVELASWLEAKAPRTVAKAVALGAAVSGRVLLQCDGASRGNPGPAAAGYVISDSDGQEIYSEGVALGRLTNNQAEYQALLLGLAAVRRLGFQELEIALDSELIVRQLAGRYKVKNAGLKPLYEDARLLLAAFKHWSVRHVPRAENTVADALANEALDSL